MPTELQQCPQKEQLVDYLLGKLPSEDWSFCEAHIADCEPCEETIRSLDASDTLSELAMNGLVKTQESANDESAVINELVNDIEGWSQSGETGNVRSLDSWDRSDLQDRAAEVQYFFEECVDEDWIGTVGKYRIVELLGAGSSGVVYRAIDTQLGRDVAVKFLRPSLGVAARQRFLTEAKAAAVINHPNVVQIYEVGLEDKLAFIAMQCLPGRTLEQILADRGSLQNEETRSIGKQISSGLAAAHQRGIIHRDIKPANIWICSQTQNVTILDFGLARIVDEDPQLTCTGLIAGTPSFMSPEQTRGRNIDPRSDFFSLGCLLYQCLTGVLPFKSENVLATLQSVQMLTPTAPDDLDPGVDRDLSSLVMTLLEKSPINRPSHANDVAAAFELPSAKWNFAPAKKRQAIPAASSNVKASLSSKSARWWPTIVSMIALGFCIVGGYFMPQIIRIATNQGQIVIESNDPDVQIEVLKGGERIEIVDLKTQQKLDIVAGEYQIRPMGNENEITIDKGSVTISRGSETIVRVTREKKMADLATDSTSLTPENSDERDAGPYTLDTGDVLGVFIENVLGEFGKAPPVIMPPAGSDLPPALGFPIVVREEGAISLPLIPDLQVRGLTLLQAEALIERAYRGGDKPILINTGRIIVTLSRKRGYKPPALRVPGSIAMAAAQYGAAEAEYGSDHPFVEQLRSKLEAALRDSDQSKPESEVSQVEGKSHGLQTDVPMYNGRSYEELFRVAKFERNPSMVLPAVFGLIQLFDESNKAEAIQVSLEFLRRYRLDLGPRSTGTKLLHSFGAIVDAATLADILISEIRSGTNLSQVFIVECLLAHTDESKRKEVLSSRKEELVKAAVQSATENKLKAKYAAMLLEAIHAETNMDFGSIAGVPDLLVSAFADSDVNWPDQKVIEFAMRTLSNSPEIVAAIFGMTMKAVYQDSQTKFIYERLTNLSPDELKVCVPLVSDHGSYRNLLSELPSKGETVDPTRHQERLFELIAAMGDHAAAFKDDFEKFEEFEWDDNGSYEKARNAVLGVSK